MMRTTFIGRSFVFLSFAFLMGIISAQDPVNSDFYPVVHQVSAGTDFFGTDEIQEISLKFDISFFIRKKPVDDYLDAELVFYNSPEDSVTTKIKLRSRGVRRNELCQFPPIRLNFNKASVGFSDLDSIGNVKLVTHCKGGKIFERYLMKEYLAYKLFNIVTDTSFRVRLLKINYIDTGRKNNVITSYGFVIEPSEIIERRIQARELEDIIVRESYINRDALDRMAMFNMMIGNVDFQVETLHNIKTYKPVDFNNVFSIVIPYDFDYSGLVNTYYAVPTEHLYITDVTQRIYLGPCRDEARYRSLADEFMGHREDFINVIEQFEYLDQNSKREMLNFLAGFFTACETGSIIRKMKDDCIDYNQ